LEFPGAFVIATVSKCFRFVFQMKKSFFLRIVFGLIGSTSFFSYADTVADVPTFVGDTTSSFLFDESINHQSGFTIAQTDQRLKDLFNPAGASALCGPTSLANIISYQKLWRASPFPNLLLIEDPLQGDYSKVVRDFASRCHTDPTSGTLISNLIPCLQQYLSESGYTQPQISLIGSAAQGADRRIATIDDIRDFAKKDWGILLEMLWYTFNKETNSWTTDKSGHYVAVVGYDYDNSWGDTKIHLKVVNPEVDYRSRDANSRWDSVEMFSYPVKAGLSYPPLTRYVLDGFSFKGIKKRAFVRNIIAFIPEETVTHE
jgi:hypothetical protein